MLVDPLLHRNRFVAPGEASGAESVGPWADGATHFVAGAAVKQSRPGSCVAACGQMLSLDAKTEAEFLEELGEWSDAGALALALNAGANGPWVAGGVGSPLAQILGCGPAAIELKTLGSRAHMVVVELLEAHSVLVRDPAQGASYVQPVSTLQDNYWNLIAVYRDHGRSVEPPAKAEGVD